MDIDSRGRACRGGAPGRRTRFSTALRSGTILISARAQANDPDEVGAGRRLGMSSRGTPSDNEPLDPIVAEFRRDKAREEGSYRARALKLLPHVCGHCGREFAGQRLRELTVHHKDHDHDEQPARRQQLGTALPLLPRQRARPQHRRRRPDGRRSGIGTGDQRPAPAVRRPRRLAEEKGEGEEERVGWIQPVASPFLLGQLQPKPAQSDYPYRVTSVDQTRTTGCFGTRTGWRVDTTVGCSWCTVSDRRRVMRKPGPGT